jgi:hypothetical protein
VSPPVGPAPSWVSTERQSHLNARLCRRTTIRSACCGPQVREQHHTETCRNPVKAQNSG